jgi:acyl transferase domain-containing protein
MFLQATQAAVAPLLNLRTVNPYLHSALHSPSGSLLTQVPRSALPWSNKTPGGLLVGGVSSFAFMGTNGHALVAGPLTRAGAEASVAAGE